MNLMILVVTHVIILQMFQHHNCLICTVMVNFMLYCSIECMVSIIQIFSICTRNPGEPEALLQTTLNAQYQTVWVIRLWWKICYLRHSSHTNKIYILFLFFFWSLVIVFREICSFCLNIELSGTSLWVLKGSILCFSLFFFCMMSERVDIPHMVSHLSAVQTLYF